MADPAYVFIKRLQTAKRTAATSIRASGQLLISTEASGSDSIRDFLRKSAKAVFLVGAFDRFFKEVSFIIISAYLFRVMISDSGPLKRGSDNNLFRNSLIPLKWVLDHSETVNYEEEVSKAVNIWFTRMPIYWEYSYGPLRESYQNWNSVKTLFKQLGLVSLLDPGQLCDSEFDKSKFDRFKNDFQKVCEFRHSVAHSFEIESSSYVLQPPQGAELVDNSEVLDNFLAFINALSTALQHRLGSGQR